MKNKIKLVLLIFFILAIVTIAIAGIILVLDIKSFTEIKDAIIKTMSILGILAVLSIVGVSVIKSNE